METESRWRGFAAAMLYGIACGLLMTLFVMVPGVIRFVFSLVALWLGLRFFRAHETVWRRVGFVFVSILFFILSVIAYTMYVFVKHGTAP
ncbi:MULTISPECIES: hypothetical protein [Paenibacillus]|uniref:hypothetical protein n=1 Tax=Paenibacillus TaxID=44249 RepID=UPI00038FA047|nr:MULTISPECIES: hypothetical protein [Paenibacillus]KKC46873.1 hypothetical protein VE23_06570 [Paenibacillus sp. D9]CDN44680.1 Putative uncharacterized protein [Paenibacillus sp. P22]